MSRRAESCSMIELSNTPLPYSQRSRVPADGCAVQLTIPRDWADGRVTGQNTAPHLSCMHAYMRMWSPIEIRLHHCTITPRIAPLHHCIALLQFTITIHCTTVPVYQYAIAPDTMLPWMVAAPPNPNPDSARLSLTPAPARHNLYPGEALPAGGSDLMMTR